MLCCVVNLVVSCTFSLESRPCFFTIVSEGCFGTFLNLLFEIYRHPIGPTHINLSFGAFILCFPGMPGRNMRGLFLASSEMELHLVRFLPFSMESIKKKFRVNREIFFSIYYNIN